MNYKLAQKLKDAGFPSLQKMNDLFLKENLGNVSPTLDEIIEECGEYIFVIRQKHKKWWASSYPIINEGTILTSGKTPIIAVSNLYIKLNSK